MKTTVAPSAPAPTTVHGPMIQPMSVAKRTRSPGSQVGLVRGLARDREQERRPGRGARPSAGPVVPEVYARRYGASLSTSSGGELAGRVGDELVPVVVAPGGHRRVDAEPAPDDDVLDRRRLGERLVGDLLHRHRRAPAERGVRRDRAPSRPRPRAARRSPARRSRRRSAPGSRRCARTRATRSRPAATSAGTSRPRRPRRRRARRAPRRAASPRARARSS